MTGILEHPTLLGIVEPDQLKVPTVPLIRPGPVLSGQPLRVAWAGGQASRRTPSAATDGAAASTPRPRRRSCSADPCIPGSRCAPWRTARRAAGKPGSATRFRGAGAAAGTPPATVGAPGGRGRRVSNRCSAVVPVRGRPVTKIGRSIDTSACCGYCFHAASDISRATSALRTKNRHISNTSSRRCSGSDLSPASAREQGDDAAPAVLAELAELNRAYEERFGFRFVVFVNRRPRSAIVPVLRERLEEVPAPRSSRRASTSLSRSPSRDGDPDDDLVREGGRLCLPDGRRAVAPRRRGGDRGLRRELHARVHRGRQLPRRGHGHDEELRPRERARLRGRGPGRPPRPPGREVSRPTAMSSESRSAGGSSRSPARATSSSAASATTTASPRSPWIGAACSTTAPAVSRSSS